MIHIPELGNGTGCSGSWIVSRKNGDVIGEFFDRRSVERFNPETCFVETAGQYLARLNRAIRDAGGIQPERAALYCPDA